MIFRIFDHDPRSITIADIRWTRASAVDTMER